MEKTSRVKVLHAGTDLRVAGAVCCKGGPYVFIHYCPTLQNLR